VFWELSTDRSFGFSLGPIPSRSIREYAKDHYYDDDEYLSLRSILRAMDGVLLNHFSKKREEQSPTAEPTVSDQPLTPELFLRMFKNAAKENQAKLKVNG
jgi:hypothetical protein